MKAGEIPLMWRDYLASCFVHTCWMKPLIWLRYILSWNLRRRHPELRDYFFEPIYISRLLKKTLSRDSVCIDIGAHLGSILSQITICSPNGHHMAVEASPQKSSWLQRKFRGTSIKNVALGRREATVAFAHNISRSGMSHVQRNGDKISEDCRVFPIRMTTLDHLVPKDFSADFIKIDVEGSELDVLQGGIGFISRCRPQILFESIHSGLNAVGHRPKDLYDFFSGLNYQVFLVKHFLEGRRPLTLAEFEGAHEFPFPGVNFFAIPTKI